MATPPLRRTILSRIPNPLCARCLSISTALQSGHSKWSSIKHDKAINDKRTATKKGNLAKAISQASRLYGGDPNDNPRLAAVIALAKKAQLQKSLIESSIARGQGKSTTGAALENLTLEVLFAPGVGLVIDIETESKNRVLSDLRWLVKKYGGAVTPTSFLFTKRGRVQFEKDSKALSVDDVLDEAIEAGAEDVEAAEDGSIVVWTEPSQTNAAAQALSKSLDLKIQSTDILWEANEDTKATLDTSEGSPCSPARFKEFLEKLKEFPEVSSLYANLSQGSTSDEYWDEIESQLD